MEKSAMKIHKATGILIACEGISGCGKSESIVELSGYLESLGYCVHTAEWNSNKKIRSLVKYLHNKNLLNAFTYCILQWISFLKDYYTSFLPLLKKDYIIIADRYIYTGMTRDKVNGTTNRIGRLISKLVRTPDIIFFFDTNPIICKKRIQIRKKELFHTNKNIHNNRLLKDKELYYLKKIRYEYVHCFDKLVIAESTNVINIINNNCYMNEFVKDYIDQKSNNESQTQQAHNEHSAKEENMYQKDNNKSQTHQVHNEHSAKEENMYQLKRVKSG